MLKEETVKLIKYFTSILLFLIALIFVGEIYVWHLESFETEYPYVTFYLQKDTTEREMIDDIHETAGKEEVSVFVVERAINSLFSEDINIYGTDETVSTLLAATSDVRDGSYDSIFLGKVNVTYHNWQEIPNIGKVNNYYVIGEDENILEFKKALVNKYAGKFPQTGYQMLNSKQYIGIVWGCVILFIVLFTLYEIASLKKNIIIRITMGEQILYFVLKQIVCDIVVYLLLFTGLMHLLKNYTNTFFRINTSIIFLVLLLLLNSMVYLWLFFTDYKQDMQTKKSAMNVLRISYVYKMFISILIILLMTGCFELIVQGVDCYRQKPFFEEHKEEFYITLGGRDFDDAKNLFVKFYDYAMEQEKEMWLIDLENWETDAEYILADRGATDYLLEKIPELQEMELENKLYYILPEKYADMPDVVSEMEHLWSSYCERNGAFEMITYDDNLWLMAISNMGKVNSALKKNPVVIFNHMEDVKLSEYSTHLYLGNATVFNLTDTEYDNIIQENHFEEQLHYKTNVYENYLYFWTIMKRNMFMGIVLLAILFILEGLIIKSILKYEYTVHAKELLLNKIQGSSFLHRHKRIIRLQLIEWAGLAIAVLVCFFLEYSATPYLILGGILIMILEQIFIVGYAHKLSNVNISKIFKGGLL